MPENKAEQQLATQSIGRLLAHYAFPAIVAMVAASLYNMADAAFIGQCVGPMAISGLAITFPLMNISSAFGAAIGVGASTGISIKLGQRDYATANKIFGCSVSLKIVIGILLMVFTLPLLDPILRFFGATDATLPYARDYMVIILIGSIFTHLYFGLNGILRAVGKPRQAMQATLFTVIVNIILDPIFIYVFQWGIQGAAWATVLSQALALCWQIKIMNDPDLPVRFQRGIYRMRPDLVGNILAIGISPFAMNTCACIVVLFINTTLVYHGGDLAVGAYGIANRIGFVFFMVVMGINQGMQPIAGYNYGARQLKRVIQVLRLSAFWATIVMTAGWLIGELLPEQCARVFTSDPELIAKSAHAMRINMLLFPIIGFQAVVTNFFQSIRKALISILLSLSRQMLILLPLLVILPPRFGEDGVWYSLPASDGIATLITLTTLIVYASRHRHTWA